MGFISDKEQLILKERANGVSNADIARKYNFTPQYVSKTFKTIREKVKTVDSTLSLLKETGYVDNTASLPVTANTIAKLNDLPIPTTKLRSKKITKSPVRSKTRARGIIAMGISFKLTRVEIVNVSYEHMIPAYDDNSISLNELMIAQ